jgi:RNA polymerase sigma factor (sigma-70 family)
MTVLRVYLNERRRPWRRHEEQHATPPDAPVSLDEASERTGELVSALDRLGPRQRAVVVLRFWEDLSVRQVAEILDCSIGTVTSQTHRALESLRNTLADPRPDGA